MTRRIVTEAPVLVRLLCAFAFHDISCDWNNWSDDRCCSKGRVANMRWIGGSQYVVAIRHCVGLDRSNRSLHSVEIISSKGEVGRIFLSEWEHCVQLVNNV